MSRGGKVGGGGGRGLNGPPNLANTATPTKLAGERGRGGREEEEVEMFVGCLFA